MTAPPPKEYGLIRRKKPTSSTSSGAALPATKFSQSSRLAAFADSSSCDSDDAAAAPKSSASKVNVTLGAVQQRQIAKAQTAALAADPTIYQYDELYDDLLAKRDSAKVAAREATATADKRPKYIERLLVTAESRKKEYERRIERQVQKERDAEGAQFADKEQFVTASYRAKLEEMRAAEAEERRDEYLEAIGDVRKQRDLGGFYRHLYEQRMGGGGGAEGGEEKVVRKPELPTEDGGKGAATTVVKKTRTYRKRDSGGSAESDVEQPEASTNKTDVKTAARKEQHHLQSNLDADSDFSIDSTSSEEDEEAATDKADKVKPEADQKPAGRDEIKSDGATSEFAKPEAPAPKPDDQTPKVTPAPVELPVAEVAEVAEVKAPKIRVNIWLKRTVGDVLEAAIERYQERKRARLEDAQD